MVWNRILCDKKDNDQQIAIAIDKYFRNKISCYEQQDMKARTTTSRGRQALVPSHRRFPNHGVADARAHMLHTGSHKQLFSLEGGRLFHARQACAKMLD
jgi:hypothetical protein